ncbi:MAG: hypothetical protein Q4D04_01085 [Clostridia bacterium]|nr:hypothetical protein [Clostridia bacterium]
MKKLFIKLGILFICCGIILVAVDRYTRGDYSSFQKRYAAMPEKFIVANTGDSHARAAFNYDEFDIAGFNFGMTSQTLPYDYNLVKQYMGRFDEGAVLLIVVSYYTPWADDSDDQQKSDRDIRYIGILDDIPNTRLVDNLVNRYLPVLTLPDRRILSIFRPNEPDMMDDEEIAASGMTMEEIGKNRAEYHMRHIVKDGAIKPFNDDNIRILGDMVSLADENGVKCVIMTTPYTNAYTMGFDEEILEIFFQKMNEVAVMNDISFWDYSTDERFTSSDDNFRDSDHLNAEAAKAFTGIVIDRLISEGLLNDIGGDV